MASSSSGGLRLTHIGEVLIASMFNRAPAVRRVFSGSLGVAVDGHVAAVEAPLLSHRELGFDGASRIDVALVDARRRTCVPCEAKLGMKGMSSKAFTTRFLRACGTSHEDRRVRGSMPAILERKLPGSADGELLATVDGDEFRVTERWGLIVRSPVARKWESTPPELSESCAVLVFEDVVSAYGGPIAFNELVREVTRFDYHAAWLL